MTDAQYRQALALFRYGLIAEFIQLPAGSRGLYARLREKARADYTIPGSTRTRVAAGDAAPLAQGLPPRRVRCAAAQGARRSRPLARTAPGGGRCAAEPEGRAAAPVDPAVDPRRAAKRRGARVAWRCRPPPCTGCLSRAGLMHKASAERASTQDRRRFAFAHAGQLWMSDVMHGPSVAHARARRGARPISSPSSTMPPAWCPTAPSRCPRTPKRSCRCSSRRCCVAAFRNACTSTTAPTTARSTSRWCAPSSASP